MQSDTEDAEPEVTWMYAVSKAVAQSQLHDSEHAEQASAQFRRKGLQEVAEALIKQEVQWTAHSLGDVGTIKALAELASEMHGEQAVETLKAEGNSLYQRGAVGKAVVKWRAAIWLAFSKEYSSDLYYIWDILNSRHTLWEKVRIFLLRIWLKHVMCADAIAGELPVHCCSGCW